MRIWAKTTFGGQKDAERLCRAFFYEFNPQNSIIIKNKEAKIEVFFKDEPPKEIIEAISQCEEFELHYGKELGEYEESETEQNETYEDSEKINTEATDEETSEHTNTEVADEETSEQIDGIKPKRSRFQPAKKVEEINIPELKEIAQKATSFQNFIQLVAEWLEMGKKQEFFESLVTAATEVNNMSWKEIEKALKAKSIFYSSWDKISVSQLISTKLVEYSVTCLPFLNVIVQYKDYSFGQQYSDKHHSTEEVSITAKINCISEIPELKSILESVDKTQSIDEIVMYVLTAMGLQKKNKKEQWEISEIAKTALELENINFEDIFSRVKLPMDPINSRMIFSEFINDFVKENHPSKKVKLLDFLNELKKSVE